MKMFFNSDEMLSIFLKKYHLLNLKNAQMVSVSSISGSTKILVFEADMCKINTKEVGVLIGIYDDCLFKNKGFDAIISPKMLEEENV